MPFTPINEYPTGHPAHKYQEQQVAKIHDKIISFAPDGSAVIFYRDKEGNNKGARYPTKRELRVMRAGVPVLRYSDKAIRKRTRRK